MNSSYLRVHQVMKFIACSFVLLLNLLGCAHPSEVVQAPNSPLAAWAIEVNPAGDVYTFGLSGLLVAQAEGGWDSVPGSPMDAYFFAATEAGLLFWVDEKELRLLDEATGEVRELSTELDHVRGVYSGKRTLVWGSMEDDCAQFPGGIGIVQSSADGIHWRTEVLENDGAISDLCVDANGLVWFLTTMSSVYRSSLLPDGGVDVPTRIGSTMRLARAQVQEDVVLASPAPRSVWISGRQHDASDAIMQSYDGGESWSKPSHSQPLPVAVHSWSGFGRVFLYPTDKGCTIRVWQDGDGVELVSLDGAYVDAAVHEDQLYLLTRSSSLAQTQVRRVDLRTGEAHPFP